MRRLPVGLLFIGIAAVPAAAQQPFDVQAHYQKQEVMIPMRDGVRLFTSIMVPRDTGTTHPIHLLRTPYSCAPYGGSEPPGALRGQQSVQRGRADYILVCQDVRGRLMSEGQFMDVRPYLPVKHSPADIDETSDTYDTIEWLLRNLRHHNGRVGMSGVSYPGFYSWMGTIAAHPAMRATSPQAPVSKWMGGDDFFHHGALLLSHALDFYGAFGWPRPEPTQQGFHRFDHGTPDGYQFYLELGGLANVNPKFFHDSVAFWNQMAANDHWTDFWAARDVLQHLHDLTPARLVVGGWFDTENLFGALNSYRAAEERSPGNNYLVMGPWSHGQWGYDSGDSLGARKWGSATGRFYTDSIETPFFEFFLRDQGTLALPEALVFNTGANEWRRLDHWPPSQAAPRTLYLGAEGSLTFDGPSASGAAPGAGPSARPPVRPSARSFDEYINDPARPVPYTAEVRHWYDPGFMLEDQRFAARRPDVLVYQTEPLAEDLTLAGPITAHLVVSTSGTDADWIVKVIDVYPDALSPAEARQWFTRPNVSRAGGFQMLVRGDVLRGKFRNSLERPEPFEPGAPTVVEFKLEDAFHTFRAGHRIMVQVQSTWFPMVDRNPGKFMNIFQATDADFQRTTQRVYHDQSYVRIQVLGK
jgi:putative CocE/NonD family hydrolase